MNKDDGFNWDASEETLSETIHVGKDECRASGEPNWRDDWLPFAKKSAIGTGLIAVVVVVWIGGSWLVRAAGPHDVRIELQGSGVSILKPGAGVIFGSTEVGQVEKVAESAGGSLAVVRLNKDFVATIPQASQFEVDSLNDWLPGNVGVRVFPASTERNRRSSKVPEFRLRREPCHRGPSGVIFFWPRLWWYLPEFSSWRG